MKRELPIIQKALDLSKELVPRAARFPKEYKYVLGDRIMNQVLDIQDLLIKAAYSKRKSAHLDEANIRLEQLRFLLRLTNELGGMANKGYAHVSKLVDELGRQIGGWRKQASGK